MDRFYDTRPSPHIHRHFGNGGFEMKTISVGESILAQFQKYSLSVLTHLWTLCANKRTLGMHVAQR